MKSYVYKIVNTVNNKYYIGKSNNPYKRWSDHISISKNGKYGDGTFQAIHAAIKKYGYENFKLNIIEEYDSEQKALENEILLIKNAKTNGDQIYNLTDGGDGISGYKHTEKSKSAMSAKRKGKLLSEETKNKLSIALQGRIRSIEHCQSISLSKIGKPNPGAGLKNAERFRGEKSNTARLTEKQVLEIINLINQKNLKLKEIAKIYGVHDSTISNIKSGKSWNHLNYLVKHLS